MHKSVPSAYVDNLHRVMPTVFVAGPAKSGSTFLWDCLHGSFHPEQICKSNDEAGWSDARCSGRRFLLPALAADVTRPGCLRPQKESAFWRYWGRRPEVAWAQYGGPRFPLGRWRYDGSSCGRRHQERATARLSEADGPRRFAHFRDIEDACLQDSPCGPKSGNARVAYNAPMPPLCRSICSPCAHHPGWVNNIQAPCGIASYKCASRTCSEAPYVPKALRRANYSAYHARIFTITAFPSFEELVAANVTPARVTTIEGNPGLFQTPPRHARALASLTTQAGRAEIRLVVGHRNPYDLAFSLWAFLATIGQEGRRVEHRIGRALEAVQACNSTLADDPMLLLHLSKEALAQYRSCLDDRKRSRHHFYLYGGLYALHMLGWLHLGFKGSQFLLVQMSSLPRTGEQAFKLQLALASFLDLPQPRKDSKRRCLSASMITTKSKIIRAHNASVRAVKHQFLHTHTAGRLRRFLAGHQALLDVLIKREGLRVF